MAPLNESDDLAQAAPDSPNEEIGANSTDLSGIEHDRALVGRCLSGEVGAWDELYDGAHPAVVAAVRVFLGGGPADPNLVDEIAARVWFSIIKNDGRLLARFDPGRGARLLTFLRLIAKTEVFRHFRGERRRQQRERIALGGRPTHQPADDAQTALFADIDAFLVTLTPKEREFWQNHLAGSSAGENAADGHPAGSHAENGGPLSSNARQLRRRIREKLLKFIE